jgi:uncharacterized protein YraI
MRVFRGLASILLLSTPVLASAAPPAYTLRPTEVYAGPGRDYPSVGQLPPSVQVDVAGCVRGYHWCDVSWRGDRGWVYANDLETSYKDRRAALVDVAPGMRLPVVTFSLGNYWDEHYRSRPFYRDRENWAKRAHDEGDGDDRARDAHAGDGGGKLTDQERARLQSSMPGSTAHPEDRRDEEGDRHRGEPDRDERH